MTWREAEEPEIPKPSLLGWAMALLRAVPLAVLVFGGLALLLLLRLIERPLHGAARPITPHITQFVCRNALRLLGLGYRVEGTPMTHKGAVVANHSSWLDIFALNACQTVYFVSKAEVAGWPGIGWLARATGTVFIKRDPKEARAQKQVFDARLAAGHKLLFFPEGTSTDGLQVLPFKSTLFAAFFEEDMHREGYVQPVSVHYFAPEGQSPRFYGWWGDMEFGPHFLSTLAALRQGSITVKLHPPLKISDYTDRKALAAQAEAEVRAGFSGAAQ